MTKIQVPPAMLKAARNAGEWGSRLLTGYEHQQLEASLKAALRWLSENPIVPTEEQAQEMTSAKAEYFGLFEKYEWVRWGASEWQRRMFLDPEPEVPEEIRDLLEIGIAHCNNEEDHNRMILEAYKRGKESK